MQIKAFFSASSRSDIAGDTWRIVRWYMSQYVDREICPSPGRSQIFGSESHYLAGLVDGAHHERGRGRIGYQLCSE